MPTVWEALQEIVSLTRHVSELQTQLRESQHELDEFRLASLDRIRALETELVGIRTTAEAAQRHSAALEERLRAAEGRMIALETSHVMVRESVRETVRDTLRVAFAEERARQAEGAVRRPPPALDEG